MCTRGKAQKVAKDQDCWCGLVTAFCLDRDKGDFLICSIYKVVLTVAGTITRSLLLGGVHNQSFQSQHPKLMENVVVW